MSDSFQIKINMTVVSVLILNMNPCNGIQLGSNQKENRHYDHNRFKRNLILNESEIYVSESGGGFIFK